MGGRGLALGPDRLQEAGHTQGAALQALGFG